MAGVEDAQRAFADGAVPLAVLVAAGTFWQPLSLAVAALYLTFAAGMASGGAERPGEPRLSWTLYAVAAGGLAVAVPLSGVSELLVLPPLALFAVGFVSHIVDKARHGGACRIGLLSAFGRRRHDARIGRSLEATMILLAGAVVLAEPALFAVAGWLVTAAAVAERPTSEPAARPLASAPAQVA